MRMYSVGALLEKGYDLETLEEAGVVKAFQMRQALLRLKHETKELLKAGVKTVDVQRLNERLQHIAKIPRPGFEKRRCGERCRCGKGLVDGR